VSNPRSAYRSVNLSIVKGVEIVVVERIINLSRGPIGKVDTNLLYAECGRYNGLIS
jgi:hypothetical protein